MSGRGKSLIALGAALVVGLVVCAGAAATEKSVMVGTFAGGGKAKVIYKTYRRDGERQYRVRWRLSHITVRCDGDGQPRLTEPVSGSNGGTQLRNHPFGTTLIAPKRYKAAVRGEVESPTRAHGSIRVVGKHVPLKGGGEADCDSGPLRFKTRVHPTPLPSGDA